jgi:hypothetical protein
MDNQNVELHEDEMEIVDEAQQMPVGTEEESIASVKKAEAGAKAAKKRKGDKSNSDSMGKVTAGDPEKASESYDFSDDLDALIAEEATLSEAFKAKSAIIFEAAIKSKISEEVARLEQSYAEQLEEEVQAIHEGLVEKVDSYLNYVVENWMEENQLAIQNGLRTEIAEGFMGKLKDLFVESYIEVPDSKVDLVDELSEQVSELEEKLNKTTAAAIKMSEELEMFQREAIIREHSADLADTQVEKLNSLVESIDFEDVETFSSKVKTVKEAYFRKNTVSEDVIAEDVDSPEETQEVVSSSAMDRYLAAIRKTSK